MLFSACHRFWFVYDGRVPSLMENQRDSSSAYQRQLRPRVREGAEGRRHYCVSPISRKGDPRIGSEGKNIGGRPTVEHEILDWVSSRLDQCDLFEPVVGRNILDPLWDEIAVCYAAGFGSTVVANLIRNKLGLVYSTLCYKAVETAYDRIDEWFFNEPEARLVSEGLVLLKKFGLGPFSPGSPDWFRERHFQPNSRGVAAFKQRDANGNIVGAEALVPVKNGVISPVAEQIELVRELRSAGVSAESIPQILASSMGISGNNSGNGSSLVEKMALMKELQNDFGYSPREARLEVMGNSGTIFDPVSSQIPALPKDLPQVQEEISLPTKNQIPALTDQIRSVSPVDLFNKDYEIMKGFIPDLSLSSDEILVGLQNGIQAALDLWKARQPGKAVVSEESVSAQNQISALSPADSFKEDYKLMQAEMPEFVLSTKEFFVGIKQGFDAALSLWEARQSAGVVPSPVVKPVLEEVFAPEIDPVPETALSVVEEISPVVVPEEIVPEVAPVVSKEIPVEVVTEEKPVRIIRDGIPEMVNGYEKPLGYCMDVDIWKSRAKFSYSRGLDIIPLYDSELERQLMAHFLNDGVFPKSETLEDLAIEFPNGVVSKPGGIIPVPEFEVCYKNSGDLTLNFYIQQGVIPNFYNKFGRDLFDELTRPGTSMINWEGKTVKVQDVSGVFEKSPKYFSIDGVGTCVPVGEVGPGVGRFKLPDNTNYPAFPTYSVMSLVRQLPPQENMDLVPRNNEDLGNFMNDRDTLVTAHTALSCLIMEYETKMLPRLALRLVMERMIEAYYGLDTRTGWNGMLYYGDQLMPPVQPMRIETRRPPSWAIPAGWTWVTFCGLYPTEWLDRAKCLQCSGRVFRSELSLLLGRNLNYGDNGTTLPGLFLCPKGPTVEEEARLKGKGDVSGMWAMTLPERIFKCLESEISRNVYADDAHCYVNAFWKIVPVEDLVRLGADLNYKYQTGVRPKEGFLWDIPTSFDFKELGFKDAPLITYCPPDSRQCGKFL